jgi:hypothetical protein
MSNARATGLTNTLHSGDGQARFRDAGIYIGSAADGKLTISADGTGADDINLAGSVKVTEGLQVDAIARTATADGTGTGAIPSGASFVTVTCDTATKIITLPPPVVGHVIWLRNGATGYELRSSDPATIAINGGTGASAESAVGANVLVRAVCDTATTWVANTYSTIGTEAALEAAA